MKEQLFILAQMALDLKRSAVGSEKMREVFLKEFLKKKNDIKINSFSGYVNKILNINFLNTDREDLLMYSTILQNYARTN